MPSSPSTASDHEAIRNTLATYCIALDTKDFDLLDQVFTPDVETVYPFGGTRTGLADIKAAIQKRLSPVTTQHALTTQRIVLGDNGSEASATTYFTGIHFGMGKWESQQVTAWGTYEDRLRRGEDGAWRVCWRKVGFVKRLGEEGVMDGE